MTADALDSIESRIGEDIAGLKHDIRRLDLKIDVKHRATDEKLDRGIQKILEHLQTR